MLCIEILHFTRTRERNVCNTSKKVELCFYCTSSVVRNFAIGYICMQYNNTIIVTQLYEWQEGPGHIKKLKQHHQPNFSLASYWIETE